MAYVARKRITLSGTSYGAGEVVPLTNMALDTRLVRRLIEQRRVVLRRDIPEASSQHTVAKPVLTPNRDMLRKSGDFEIERQPSGKSAKKKAPSKKG